MPQQKIKSPAVKIAMCNFIKDTKTLRSFAHEHGFDGIDWSFDLTAIPQTPREESLWTGQIKGLAPLEIRYHCPFSQVDIGHEDPAEQQCAVNIFRRIIRMVSKAEGRYLTIHVGLGLDTTRILSWESTIERLRDLVQFAAGCNVRLCLENLAWGWTAKPNLFEKLIRHTGAGVTFDIGHARACQAVQTQQFSPGDFISPHISRLCNAHVYHDEVDNVGHVPPLKLSDISDRLDLLVKAGCNWWTLEIREARGLIQTKKIIDQYLMEP